MRKVKKTVANNFWSSRYDLQIIVSNRLSKCQTNQYFPGERVEAEASCPGAMFLGTDDRGWLVMFWDCLDLQPYGRTWSKRLDVTYIRSSQVKINGKRKSEPEK